jgi:Trypsin-co-occurring domain 1
MKHLVEFPLEDGSSIVVEVDEPEIGGTVRANRAEKIEKAKETIEQALDKVLPITKHVVEKLRSMGHEPDEIEVKFGIKLGTVASVFIASGSADANFEVTVHWAEKAVKTKDSSTP